MVQRLYWPIGHELHEWGSRTAPTCSLNQLFDIHGYRPTNQTAICLGESCFLPERTENPSGTRPWRTGFLHLCSKPKLKHWGRFTACSFSSSSPWEASVSFVFLHICDSCSVSEVKCNQSGGWSLAMFIWCLCRNWTQKNSVWLRSLLFITFILAI